MTYWQKVNLWHIPPNAVSIGHDVDGHVIYVGRAFICQELAPGKLIPQKGGCFIPYNGREVIVTDCEVLTVAFGHTAGSLEWVPSSRGNVPNRAVEAGYNANGVKFYVGRTFHGGAMVCGKIHPKYGVLYFPFGGLEITAKEYETLAIARGL